ncbi:hypothetical protein HanIR_Chr15g0761221 [Helianthus annuus]|nr:hypothetical protein HanIR_Chr15g0761221 [Helianthus annuus]
MISLHFMLCMPIVCVLSTLFTLHFMLCMPIVCVLSTLFHITFHAMYAHCVRT